MTRFAWTFSLLCLSVFCAAPVGAERANAPVTIKESDVPAPNSRPHDPAVAPDGSLWCTGQMAHNLWRFDPRPTILASNHAGSSCFRQPVAVFR